MEKLYKRKISDNTLGLKCAVLCILMIFVSFVCEMPRESIHYSSSPSGSSLLSDSQLEYPEVKTEPRTESYQLIRSTYVISESRAVSSRTEISFAAFVLLLAAILLLVLAWYTPTVYRSAGNYCASIIQYIHDQDGLK